MDIGWIEEGCMDVGWRGRGWMYKWDNGCWADEWVDKVGWTLDGGMDTWIY